LANKAFAAIGLDGGSSGFLDSIKTATITDQDIAFVIVNGTEEFYVYTFDSGNVADESSPDVIMPDDKTGTEAWILCDSTSGDNTIRGTLSVTGASTLTGNVAMAGNLDITGTLTFDGAGVALDSILDEDNFASDSATAVPTQQSTKAYIATVLGSVTLDVMAGWNIPPKFTWSDTDTITVGAGRTHHNGTAEQIIKWDAALTYDFGSGGSNAASDDLGASEWHYLYIDDSALSGATLTAARLRNDTTAPTWNASEGGWYGGGDANDKCIGAFWSNASSQIEEFYHVGRDIIWADEFDLAHSWTQAWQDQTMRVPALATNLEAIVTIWVVANNYGYGYWRTNGQTGTTGHVCFWAYNSGGGDNYRWLTMTGNRVVTDTSGVVEFKGGSTAAAGTNAKIYQYGYALPEGM
jgi:hypothetical protein